MIDMCDNLQNYFWRVMLTVPESCPKIALRCETGMVGMKWRIWNAKIMLLLRIKSQDSSSLSRQVYEESCARGWPGLGEEVTQICREINIPDVNNVWVTKEEIKNAVMKHHYQDMKKELDNSKKLMDIKEEDFSEVQDYFKEKSICNTRMAFKVRTKMLTEIPANVKNKFKKGDDGLVCTYCKQGKIMSQSHCLECPAWDKLRVGLDLTNIMDMVAYFRKLLDERDRQEKEDVMGGNSIPRILFR